MAVSRRYKKIGRSMATCFIGLAFTVVSQMAPAQTAEASDEGWSRENVLVFNTRRLLRTLDEALGVHDELPTLNESRFMRRDQQSAQRQLDGLIQDAMGLLESPAINQLREQLRQLEIRIEREKGKLSRYRSERVLASRDDRSLRTRLVPGETLQSMVAVSRADFDVLIEATQNNIKSFEEERDNTLNELSMALSAIGVEMTQEQVEAMMSSVIGDDTLRMSVVFNAIKDMTLQLEKLTAESGEDLAFAKKYYGMVVILHRIIATMQADFVKQVDSRFLPQLAEYRESAQQNIQASRALIREGANPDTLRNNIRSNELTIEVIDLYAALLTGQRDRVKEAHKVTEREMRVADNTYHTVSVSSAVVSMIREGTNTFEQLISLQMPDVREFQNDQVREEFRNLTARMNL